MSLGGDRERDFTPHGDFLIVKGLPASTPPAPTYFRASKHWLLRTAATHHADAGNDLHFIEKNLRHASLEPPPSIFMRRVTNCRRPQQGNDQPATTLRPKKAGSQGGNFCATVVELESGAIPPL
jgi:hypothetical protein